MPGNIIPLVKKLITLQILTVIALATVVWQAYSRYGPQMPEVSALRKTLADRVVKKTADEMPHVSSVKRVFIFKFEDDLSEYFTDELRKQMMRSNIYQVIPKGWTERVKDDLNLPEPAVSDLKTAMDNGRKIQADGVIFGVIHSFNETRDGAALDITVQFADVKQEKILFSNRYKETLPPSTISMHAYRERVNDSSLAARAFYWLLFTLILPVACVPFIKPVVQKESNFANFLILGALTLTGFIFALAMVGFQVSGISGPVFLILALIAGAGYNYWICQLIDRMK